MKTILLLVLIGVVFEDVQARATGSTRIGIVYPTDMRFKCLAPMSTGRCQHQIPRFYFDAEEGTCKSFIYRGCLGTSNNFATEEECKALCTHSTEYEDHCLVKADSGPCERYFPMWAFNANTGMCESFYYGGCAGNDNKYPTMQACYAKCLSTYISRWTMPDAGTSGGTSIEVRINPLCYLPMETGPCLDYVPRFYYNSTSERCEQFIYGGCSGNGNNFNTLGKCQDTCETTSTSRCTLEKDAGPCKGIFPRFYYNQESGTCEMFNYGGCQGNGNNFERPDLCLKICKGQNTVLPRA